MFLPLHYQNRKVAQLVAHYVRDVGVGRSSRLFPTEKRGYILYSLFFCAKPHKRNTASFRQKREDIFYILSFFVQSLISEMPPLSDRKRGYILYSLFFCAKPHKRNAATFRQKVKEGVSKRRALFFKCMNFAFSRGTRLLKNRHGTRRPH